MSPVPVLGQPDSNVPEAVTGPAEPAGKMSTTASGEGLLAAVAQHRDREAFRQIFDSYGPRIKRYLCARGAPDALADEVVQEVMINVWRKASLYDPGRARASTWIHAIARHCWLDRLRGERRPEIETDDPSRVPVEPPDESLALGGGRRALTSALRELPHTEVDVLRAAYFEGLSLREIAEQQALPLGTVKTRMRSALARLRALLFFAPENDR